MWEEYNTVIGRVVSGLESERRTRAAPKDIQEYEGVNIQAHSGLEGFRWTATRGCTIMMICARGMGRSTAQQDMVERDCWISSQEVQAL